ncbi:hypothetical protein VPH35_053859 [Triticum aestivum]
MLQEGDVSGEWNPGWGVEEDEGKVKVPKEGELALLVSSILGDYLALLGRCGCPLTRKPTCSRKRETIFYELNDEEEED